METDRERVGDPDHPGTSPTSADGAGAEQAAEQASPSPIDPPTAAATAPRAVLRPVPESMASGPLPSPGVPNRRPAPKTPEAAPSGPRWNAPVIIAAAVIAALILVVGIGGSILVYRALSPAPAPAGPSASAPEDPGSAAGGSGEVVLGEVTIREVSTERNVRRVGEGSSGGLEPEGEFVIVTFEVVNDSGEPAVITGEEPLEAADATTHPGATDASGRHIAESEAYGLVRPGESGTFHIVYDVPIGTEPSGVAFDLSTGSDSGKGVLSLGG